MAGGSSAPARPDGEAGGGAGVLFGLLAYASWGVFPAFWKQLAAVSLLVVVAHRVLWSALFLLAVLVATRRLPELGRALGGRASRGWLALSTVLISGNWLLFVWAVNDGRVLEASLGYYMNPLINVALGRIMLGEKLGRTQKLAVLLAGVGVLYFAIGVGRLPWVSLTLALSFGLYGLVRKTAPMEALTGLAAETVIAAPLAFGYLLVVGFGGAPVWGGSPRELTFLLASGVATALPLWWFALAARKLRYSTLGILQYVAPTGQLILAVALYGEPFTARHVIAFGLIWGGVALYSAQALSRGARGGAS